MHVSPPRFPVGFEEVRLDEESRHDDNMRQDDYQAYLAEHNLVEQWDAHAMPCNGYHARPSTLPEQHCHDAWVAREACRFLERRDPTAPWFLYTSFRNPHPPLCPPPSYWDLYRDREVPQPKIGNWVADHSPAHLRRLRAGHDLARVYGPAERQRAIRAYYALVTSIDHQIGLILGQVGNHWQMGKTIVLLTADHGEMLFDHESVAKSQYYRAAVRHRYATHLQQGRHHVLQQDRFVAGFAATNTQIQIREWHHDERHTGWLGRADAQVTINQIVVSVGRQFGNQLLAVGCQLLTVLAVQAQVGFLVQIGLHVEKLFQALFDVIDVFELLVVDAVGGAVGGETIAESTILIISAEGIFSQRRRGLVR